MIKTPILVFYDSSCILTFFHTFQNSFNIIFIYNIFVFIFNLIEQVNKFEYIPQSSQTKKRVYH